MWKIESRVMDMYVVPGDNNKGERIYGISASLGMSLANTVHTV